MREDSDAALSATPPGTCAQTAGWTTGLLTLSRMQEDTDAGLGQPPPVPARVDNTDWLAVLGRSAPLDPILEGVDLDQLMGLSPAAVAPPQHVSRPR